MVYIKLLLISFLLIPAAWAQNGQPDDIQELQKLYEQMQGQLQGLDPKKAQIDPSDPQQKTDPNAPGIEIDTTKITNLLNSLKSGGPSGLKDMLQGAQDTKNKMAPVVKKTYGLISDDKIRGAYANLNKDWTWKEIIGWQIAAIIFIYILRHWLNSRTKLWAIKLVHTLWTGLLLFFLSSFVVPRIIYGPAFTELVVRAFQIITGNTGGPTT